MTEHVINREKIIKSLRSELVGPSPFGKEIDCIRDIKFATNQESYGPWRQLNTGDEILHRDVPIKRYGVGVLYPQGVLLDNEATSKDEELQIDTGIDETEQQNVEIDTSSIEEIESRSGRKGEQSDNEDDFDLSTTNSYKPSSMGVSFLAVIQENSVISVSAQGGRYKKKEVEIDGKTRNWWLRSKVKLEYQFAGEDIKKVENAIVKPTEQKLRENLEDLNIQIEMFSRPYKDTGKFLITVCLVNREQDPSSANTKSLFQAHFQVAAVSDKGDDLILPYPAVPAEKLDEEEQSLALLYRNNEVFAVGHGCAANWEVSSSNRAKLVSAECLPLVETPSITSDVLRPDETVVEVSMARLAGLTGEDEFAPLEEVINLYKDWIITKKNSISTLEERYQEAARLHMQLCLDSVDCMEKGLEYLKTNAIAMHAFRLANHAILLQQVQSRRTPRRILFNEKAKRMEFAEDYTIPDVLNPPKNRGKWRAFQIAFLLMSLQSAGDGKDPERKNVELIWFPTGGGKTEAYLGLAAYAIFMRRLQNSSDKGVHTIMRYTLRLLTAQQFQRASSLMCAMEYIRQQENKKQDPFFLGEEPFSIGIWVGGTTTPIRRTDAIYSLNSLNRDKGGNAENPFIINRCPWCGAQMGLLKYKGKKPKGAPQLIGYEESLGTVVFKCPDRSCPFEKGLPVYVIDEDIYEKCPSLVIGTVDKFAMLAWVPAAKSIFGLNENGVREFSPPGLIIQDELHLISGPLGSIVGLYEAVIEDLCTDKRGNMPIPPKIVCSTATIRRYKEQVKALFGREKVMLFPPPGLEASDSFFATEARNDDGTLKPGRIYAGILAPGLGSLQTVQVRTFTSLLQAPVPLTTEERDPWWTLLLFFNSLRELGTTLSLFQSDIPDYFKVLSNRTGLNLNELRNFWHIKELTGRLRSDEVPESISALEIPCTDEDEYPVDVCLASNIIEVGVDIDRLSLMCVVGQPKTTAQYIQVTGRVGRQWYQRPGLVITIYSPTKPRDRSHYEKFRNYHERLYAQVEPTSVTPFSPPALDRALHAVMVIFARHYGEKQFSTETPTPYPKNLIDSLREIILPRIKMIDKNELENFEKVFNKRAKEWKLWQSNKWKSTNNEDRPLMRVAGQYASGDRKLLSWSTPQSMRNVDAECQVEITTHYVKAGMEEENA